MDNSTKDFYVHFFVKIIENIFRKTYDISRWFLTIGLATIGFFLTILLQMKISSQIIYSKLAFCALLSISLSMLLGIKVRIDFPIDT